MDAVFPRLLGASLKAGVEGAAVGVAVAAADDARPPVLLVALVLESLGVGVVFLFLFSGGLAAMSEMPSSMRFAFSLSQVERRHKT